MLKKTQFRYELYASISDIEPKIWRPLMARMIDINEFLITDIPPIEISNLKVKDIKDLEKIDLKKLSGNIECEVNNIVTCTLEYMFDYPALTIDKIKTN